MYYDRARGELYAFILAVKCGGYLHSERGHGQSWCNVHCVRYRYQAGHKEERGDTLRGRRGDDWRECRQEKKNTELNIAWTSVSIRAPGVTPNRVLGRGSLFASEIDRFGYQWCKLILRYLHSNNSCLKVSGYTPGA